MGLKREELEKRLTGLEGKDDIINWIMSENGKSINDLRAENEDLKSKILDQNEKLKTFADYEEVKKTNETLEAEINSYKTQAENEKYYEVLKKVGFNEEFIDENIFNKVAKTESIEEFEKTANDFLKTKPMYKAEGVKNYKSTNNNIGNNGEFNMETASDAEVLAYLKEMNK